MDRMRYPSLSLHDIECAFSAPGAKSVIPASVSGKFSIRLVPFQTPNNVNPLVEKYIKADFSKLQSRNTLELECLHGGKPWVASPDYWNYCAAIKATEIVFNKTSDLTRGGGSIPVTLTLAERMRSWTGRIGVGGPIGLKEMYQSLGWDIACTSVYADFYVTSGTLGWGCSTGVGNGSCSTDVANGTRSLDVEKNFANVDIKRYISIYPPYLEYLVVHEMA